MIVAMSLQQTIAIICTISLLYKSFVVNIDQVVAGPTDTPDIPTTVLNQLILWL